MMIKIWLSLLFFVFSVYPTQVFLKLPDLCDENIIGHNLVSSTHRIQGGRIQAERSTDKLIVHNYGYGAQGIVLSWGAAQESIELMEYISHASLPKGNPIAVIGAGVIGLTVALKLVEKGYNVALYAQDFPPHTNSCGVNGVFDMHVSAGETEADKKRFARIKWYAHTTLKKLAQTSSFDATVRLIDCFHCDTQRATDPNAVDLIFSNGLKQRALQEKTAFVIGSQYVPALFKAVQALGVRCVQRTFTSQEEFSQLSEQVIFNCVGSGSCTVCNDTHLVTTQKCYLYLNDFVGIDYVATYDDPANGTRFSIEPGSGCAVITAPVDECQDESVAVKKLLDQARAHIKQPEIKQPAWEVQATSLYQPVKMYDEAVLFALRKIQWTGRERILLLGCTNELVIDQLLAKVPRGTIECVDTLRPLVDASKNKYAKYPHLSFRTVDKNYQDLAGSYDYVIQLMTMHMPFDQEECDRIARTIKPGGAILLMLAGDNEHMFFKSIRETAKSWPSLDGYSFRDVPEVAHIKAMVAKAGLQNALISSSSCPMQFNTKEAFSQWIYQTMIHIDCIGDLNMPSKKLFLDSVISWYLARSVQNVAGVIRYDMPFNLVFAQK